MNTLKLRFEVWIDGRYNMMSIRGEREKPGPNESAEMRINYIYFVLNEKDLRTFETNSFNDTIEDGFHRMNLCGDLATFFNFELPRGKEGVLKIPFLTLEIPVFVRKMIVRMVRGTWKRLRAAASNSGQPERTPNVVIEFSQEQTERLLAKYGQGKGKVLVKSEKETLDKIADDMVKSPDFGSCYERLMQIAKNSTRAKHQLAELHVYPDRDDYGWTAFDWKKRRIMNGGLINHARDGAPPDWSIHT